MTHVDVLQTKSSLDKIFYKVVYHHIIYMCDFFLVNLDDFFAVVCTSFHESCGFHQIYFLYFLGTRGQKFNLRLI